MNRKQVIALCVVIAVSIAIFIFRDSLHELESLGYIGVFLVALIGNATLILPAPTLIFVFAAGSSLSNPLLVGVLAGVGSTVGELTGYLAGYGSNALIDKSRLYNKVKLWVEKYGVWAVGMLAFIPNPIFDLAGFASGTLGLRIRWFLLATLIGKTAKMILVAYAGSQSIEWIQTLFL